MAAAFTLVNIRSGLRRESGEASDLVQGQKGSIEQTGRINHSEQPLKGGRSLIVSSVQQGSSAAFEPQNERIPAGMPPHLPAKLFLDRRAMRTPTLPARFE
jgi:hypothetical protein